MAAKVYDLELPLSMIQDLLALQSVMGFTIAYGTVFIVGLRFSM